MVRYTARVPGYGLVEWPNYRIDSHAHQLVALHHPGRRWLLRERKCAKCSQSWPCELFVWGQYRLDTQPLRQVQREGDGR